MVTRFTRKFKSNKGGGTPVITLFLVMALFNIVFIAYSRDNSQYRWWLKTFSEGLRTSSKAALLQYDYTDENFELISQGYVIGEEEFNHFVGLNYIKANDIFFKILSISTKKNYTELELKEYSTIAIIEPLRDEQYTPMVWNYRVTLYKGDLKIEERIISSSNINQIEELINGATNKIKIDIVNGNLINKIKPRTYYIGIIENLPLKGLFWNSGLYKNINMYYFEGVNAIRSLDIREGS